STPSSGRSSPRPSVASPQTCARARSRGPTRPTPRATNFETRSASEYLAEGRHKRAARRVHAVDQPVARVGHPQRRAADREARGRGELVGTVRVAHHPRAAERARAARELGDHGVRARARHEDRGLGREHDAGSDTLVDELARNARLEAPSSSTVFALALITHKWGPYELIPTGEPNP